MELDLRFSHGELDSNLSCLIYLIGMFVMSFFFLFFFLFKKNKVVARRGRNFLAIHRLKKF